MIQFFRSDVKLVNSIIRFYSGSRISLGGYAQNEMACPNCGKGLKKQGTLHNQRSHTGNFTRYAFRQFSSKATTNPLVQCNKKISKKKKKSNKSTTEIIEETELSVSESTAKLLKVRPRELTSYLGKYTSGESTTNTNKLAVGVSQFTPGYMAYSTDCPFLLDYMTPGEPSIATSRLGLDIENVHSLGSETLTPSAVHFDSEDSFREIVITNRKPSNATIPGENDLIDSTAELEAELAGQLSTNDCITEIMAGPNPSLDESEIPTHSLANSISPAPRNATNTKMQTNNQTKKDEKLRKQQLKKKDKEAMAKVRSEELLRLAKEVGLNKSLVAFLDMCVFEKQIGLGLQTLNYYRYRSKKSPSFPLVTSVDAFNCLLHGFAAKGNAMKVNEIFKSIQEDGLTPTVQSHAAVLECLGRRPRNSANKHRIKAQIDLLEQSGYSLDDLFNKAVYSGDQRELVLQAIRRLKPSYVPKVKYPSIGYNCRLLENINEEAQSLNNVSQAEGIISTEYLQKMATKQLEMELKGTITIKSVEQKGNQENLQKYRKLLEETEAKWAAIITESVNRNFVTLLNQGLKNRGQKAIGLYPFLKVLKPKDYVEIILQEIRKLAEGSETYSPTVTQLYRELGAKVLARYQVIYKKEKGILEKVFQLYQNYLQWYMNPASDAKPGIRNSRQKWQDLMYEMANCGPDVDISEKSWPVSVQSSVGRYLYGLIIRDIKIDAQIMKLNSKTEHLVPAFYSIFRMQGVSLKEEIKPHPALVKLFQAASRDELTFDTTLVPMICPPLPWCSIRTGGYLLTSARIVRLPYQAHQQKVLLETCKPENLYPSLDSLNQLGAVPWKINQKVLDTVIEVFNNKGDDHLGIPPPPSECPLPPTIDLNMTREDKIKVHKTRLALKRKKAEMYSLWCDALYRLSLANHFRNDVFWFPHNMDFRGRVYPCPPHLNHLGADMARSILVFAKGKPLGPNGLDWLKTHLINLTGLKKRDSVEERLEYANEIMADILDSADDPLNGRQWWAKSEEPWQTLATCIEIANAIRSGNPESYVSHFPIHQDGSCNGLQHYAALGRDQAGAESVNLAPSPIPQDVYSSIASIVERLRQKDAENGVKIAQVLEGFIKRKVIKQTVMTTVYGVTRFGARLQIAKQLKDIPDFPKEYIWAASIYLVGRTFDSLQEMFTSTKEIQDWFTECARLISQICGQNVEWVTPLGLPVVQPYSRMTKRPYEAFDPTKLTESNILDAYERPNVMKQKNAFPPNFIHSLDSSHMMLTSLYSEQAGITFVSVHDCYWTHPSTVEIMNKICRQQFVALHSEPILEDLSNFMVEKYTYKDSEIFRDGSLMDSMKLKLNQLLTEIPAKGSFDLKSVLESTYFFS